VFRIRKTNTSCKPRLDFALPCPLRAFSSGFAGLRAAKKEQLRGMTARGAVICLTDYCIRKIKEGKRKVWERVRMECKNGKVIMVFERELILREESLGPD
jgi:hypothetical protein